MHTIKQTPEDFFVREISNVELKEGRFIYFTLTKKNRNTLDVIMQLAKQLRINEKNIGFAGSKDKNAITEQTLSFKEVTKEKIMKVKVDNTKLKFLGYGNKPLSLGDLSGNYFEIVIRNLDNEEINKTEVVENYFDEQRFSKNNVKIGRFIVKKDFVKSAKLIDKRNVQEHLEKNPNDGVGAMKKTSTRMLRMYVNAYQSYLWNETVAIYLNKFSIEKEVTYSEGKFIFHKEINLENNFEIPLIGFGSEELESNEIKPIIKKIMQKEEVDYSDFVIKQIPEISLEGDLRKVLVEVKDLEIGKKEDDELNSGKNKVKVSFSLNKGSYATMVIRKIVS